MRRDWSHVKGLTTVVRVLPPDLYDKVMQGDEPLDARLEHLRADPRAAENELNGPVSWRNAAIARRSLGGCRLVSRVKIGK